jgi:hypothetical protein
MPLPCHADFAAAFDFMLMFHLLSLIFFAFAIIFFAFLSLPLPAYAITPPWRR